MTLIDISRPISPRSLVYPGDPPLRMEPILFDGPHGSGRMTRLNWTTHVATHMDAPAHFLPDGATLDALPLSRFTCEARVIDVPGEAIGPDLVPPEAGTRGRALLFRSRHSLEKWGEAFDEKHVYLRGDAAGLIAARGANMVGVDYLSIDRHGDKTYPAHMALLGAGILILESLDLSAAPPGDYRLTAFPLRIVNADGSPVRAVLERQG